MQMKKYNRHCTAGPCNPEQINNEWITRIFFEKHVMTDGGFYES